MDYQEAIKFLTDLTKFGFNFGLERIKALLEMLGNPQEKLKVVHIGGTNGKGSTAAMVASIMAGAGYKVGMFSSPHLHSYTERVKINGADIPRERVAAIITAMRPLLEKMVAAGMEHPTEFEVNTALALVYFNEEKVDLAVLEVGLGGAIDSTNIIERPLVTAITNVAMDHMDYLGNTLQEIAGVKSGIIKKGVPLVTASNRPEVLEIFQSVCLEKQAPLIRIDDSQWQILRCDETGTEFNLSSPEKEYHNLELQLIGAHQVKNAATAVSVVEQLLNKGFSCSEQNLRDGLGHTVWPARLEIVRHRPKVLLDAAHNVDGALTLAAALKDIFKFKKLILVIGMLGDKEREKVLAILAPLAGAVVVTRPNNPRAGDWQKMAEESARYVAEVYLEESITAAVEKGLALTGVKDLLCVTGSFYMVAEAREFLGLRYQKKEELTV